MVSRLVESCFEFASSYDPYIFVLFFKFSCFCFSGRSFVRWWSGANVVGIVAFCVPENGGLHKIVQPFLRGHDVFQFCVPISVPQKRKHWRNKKQVKFYLSKWWFRSQRQLLDIGSNFSPVKEQGKKKYSYWILNSLYFVGFFCRCILSPVLARPKTET